MVRGFLVCGMSDLGLRCGLGGRQGLALALTAAQPTSAQQVARRRRRQILRTSVLVGLYLPLVGRCALRWQQPASPGRPVPSRDLYRVRF